MSELCRRQIIRQQQIMKKSALTVLIALLPLAAIAQTPSINEDGKKIEKEKMETKDYLPEVHGTIRAKYEYQTTMGAGRFEVRNARVSVTGNVLPSVAYKAEIDLSDEGQIKMLDAYARLFPTKGLTVTAGQMRVPFTIDAHRSPHQQYFPNRSFIAKQVGNVRDVGFTVGYTLPTGVPITVEGGLFNGSGLTNQKEWHKEVNYSAKAQFLFTKGLNLTLSVQSIQPKYVCNPTTSVPTMKPAVSISKANICTSNIPTTLSKMYTLSTPSSTTICRYGKYSTKCLSCCATT